MEKPTLILDENKEGAFVIKDGDVQLGEMVLAIIGQDLVVYHTEVSPAAEGKGLAKELLTAMVEYAREKKVMVIPLCPYVHAQFKRHPQDYQDIWKKSDDE